MKRLALCALLAGSSLTAAAHLHDGRRWPPGQGQRDSSLTVDLGYAVYQGYKNAVTGLNIWKGIRYAAAPTGALRWRPPQAPPVNTTPVPATTFAPNCPQAFPSLPAARFLPGNEDCLFLNIYAPPTNASYKLPVLVWIHGGGYGLGDGMQDLSTIISDNGNVFLGVAIQYRLGAFGFLSSSEVKRDGVVNAGLLDIAFALKWVQEYIELFGGDKTRVTISGESAGGGAVMLLGIAGDGKMGSSLFRNGIAASPWLPVQCDYNATRPTQLYNKLASSVGCPSTGAVLDCLRRVDSLTLQYVSNNISSTQTYGTWAFLPVTDYEYITSLPSTALDAKRVNGENILVGNNANEGALLVPRSISTLSDLTNWLHLEFPTFDDADIQSLLDAYPALNTSVDPSAMKFATDGYGPATAVNVSQIATGQQQRAYNIYAEATVVCPSYWLNTAYVRGKSRHYQYSVPLAAHSDDITAYFGPSPPNQSPGFSLAFRKMWGNFITGDDPSVAGEAALDRFPAWDSELGAKMVNLNESGGVPYVTVTQFGERVIQFADPGLKNAFTIADAYSWEGGRGERCEFWKRVARKIPI